MKKLISVIGAIAMMASMAVTVSADTAPISVEYNYIAEQSTEETVVIEMYTNATYDMASFNFDFELQDASGNNVTSDYISAVTADVKIEKGSSNDSIVAGLHGSKEYITLLVATEDKVLFPSSGPSAIYTITLSKAIDQDLSIAWHDTTVCCDYDFNEYSATDIPLVADTITGGEEEPTKTDATPGEVFDEPGSPKASTFTVTSAPTGTKAYWYAKIGGEPKRAAAVLPATLGGEVMLGLVFHGNETIENVQLGWE